MLNSIIYENIKFYYIVISTNTNSNSDSKTINDETENENTLISSDNKMLV